MFGSESSFQACSFLSFTFAFDQITASMPIKKYFIAIFVSWVVETRSQHHHPRLQVIVSPFFPPVFFLLLSCPVCLLTGLLPFCLASLFDLILFVYADLPLLALFPLVVFLVLFLLQASDHSLAGRNSV